MAPRPGGMGCTGQTSTMEIEPRPLDADERAILDLLLSRDFPGVHALRRHAHEVVVVGRCECGCPTIELGSPGAGKSADPGRLTPVEGRVLAEDGTPQQELLLFASDGQLRSAELAWYGDTPPVRWPAPEQVQLVEIVR